MRRRVLTWAMIVLAATTIAFGGMWRQEVTRRKAWTDAFFAQQALDTLGPGYEGVCVIVSSHPRANVVGEVRSEADLERLNAALDALDGRERIVTIVRVQPRP